MLGQPADGEQAPQQPPGADQVTVDVGSVPGEQVVEVLLVRQREDGEVEQSNT